MLIWNANNSTAVVQQENVNGTDKHPRDEREKNEEKIKMEGNKVKLPR